MLSIFFFFLREAIIEELKCEVELSVWTQDIYFSWSGVPKCSWDLPSLDCSLSLSSPFPRAPQDGQADPTSSTYLSLAETVLIYTFL